MFEMISLSRDILSFRNSSGRLKKNNNSFWPGAKSFGCQKNH